MGRPVHWFGKVGQPLLHQGRSRFSVSTSDSVLILSELALATVTERPAFSPDEMYSDLV